MARVLALALLLAARTSVAAIYESPIDIDDENDLLVMQERGDISPETMATLTELLSDGVELNDADRDKLYELPGLSYSDVDAILEYRKQKGRIDDPAELVGAGAITDKQLLQIAPFLRVVERPDQLPVQGKMRLMSWVSASDKVAPPIYFGANLRLPWNLKTGVELVTTRFRPTGPSYDSVRDTVVVGAPGYALYVPRLYAMWKAAQRQIIIGSFRVGFAERLVLDNTRRRTPYGFDASTSALNAYRIDPTSPCRLSTGELGQTPCPNDGSIPDATRDFSWRETFRGIAGSVEDIELGQGGPKLSLYGFGSMQTHSLYQYQLVDRRYCDNPNDDNNSGCAAPSIYVRQPDPNDPMPKLAYSTIPSAFHELAFGGHARLDPSPRWRLGVTGYFAYPFFNVSQMKLDFQEWSKFPWNGPFGAVGVNGRVVAGPVDLYGEFARSFDRVPGQLGGFGGVLRGVWSPKKHHVELSARLYDPNFGNPYARPVAAPDMFDGQRARNEAGLRLTYDGRLFGDLWLRSWADFWVNPWPTYRYDPTNTVPGVVDVPGGTSNLWWRARADFKGFDFIEPGIWFDYRNKDLGRSGRGACYSGSISNDDGEGFGTEFTAQPIDPATGEPLPCFGELYRASVSLHVRPYKRIVTFWLQGQQTWMDSAEWPTDFQIDRRMWLEVRSMPLGSNVLLLRLRGSYRFINAYSLTQAANQLWAFAEVAGRPWGFLRAALRYDLIWYTDQRPGTLAMNPNPQHSFRLVVDAKF